LVVVAPREEILASFLMTSYLKERYSCFLLVSFRKYPLRAMNYWHVFGKDKGGNVTKGLYTGGTVSRTQRVILSS